ncbi:MAG: NADH-quinone oxidoreductase subunit J [Chloroflexi bacterium]|nr:NADH-quinone oxidoreductase subunit J [Chloroflexota bacterium]
MIAEIAARFPFWATAILLVIGLYGMIGKRSLVKKVIGLNIFQSAVILFFISQALKADATIPILEESPGPIDPDRYINPLPHVFMLTAIVVSAAITGVSLAFLVVMHRRFRTLDEAEILKEVGQ